MKQDFGSLLENVSNVLTAALSVPRKLSALNVLAPLLRFSKEFVTSVHLLLNMIKTELSVLQDSVRGS